MDQIEQAFKEWQWETKLFANASADWKFIEGVFREGYLKAQTEERSRCAWIAVEEALPIMCSAIEAEGIVRRVRNEIAKAIHRQEE